MKGGNDWHSLDPSFARLDGEQRAHGVEDVVVVERSPLPNAFVHLGRIAGVANQEKRAPDNDNSIGHILSPPKKWSRVA